MDKSAVKLTEYKIILELHEGEKSFSELNNTLTKNTVDEIILELNQGKTDVMRLVNILSGTKGLISDALDELTGLGYVALKKPKDNKPGQAEERYWLTKTGQEFYQKVYELAP